MDSVIAREQSLFSAALLITDRAGREAFLNEACDGDAVLKARIMRLVEVQARSDEFFPECNSQLFFAGEISPGSADMAADNRLAGKMPGQRVGCYKLLEPLGEGGCGVVYLAEQEAPVRRRVALKVIKLGMDTKSVIARFDAERQALALMDHPNIARVLDAGSTDTGRSYFVMELVQGIKITRYCNESQLDTRQRLELFIQVCHAIQHAHQKGVIHRDIKPSNILVTLHDGAPVSKVIDFGIAKAIAGPLTHDTALTLQGQFVGTPAYMSPEQAERSGLDVDTRSDVYSLGVLLYELLTGRTPFDQQELLKSGLDEMRRTLREEVPPRPSRMLTSLTGTALTATAQQRHVEPPRLIKFLEGDLDWIVMKALEKDRQRRYETVNALAMDLRRYLNNEPVLARPPSRFYRIKKLVQRNKVVYASGTAVVLSLAVGFVISTWLFIGEREALLAEAQMRQNAEAARANETRLRKEAEARENVTQAAVSLSHGKIEEADALLAPIPSGLFSPSTEATTVFRALAEWNVLHGRWQKAAERYIVLAKVNQVDRADLSDTATYDLLSVEPLLVEAGDIAEYDRTRQMEMARLADTPFPAAAEQLVKTSLLLPADPSIMKLMPPLERRIADSLKDYDPQKNEGAWIPATWRSLALALLDYRRGDFAASTNWLKQCSRYPDQTPSCVATVHILRSMDQYQLGETAPARAELKAGREMVERVFSMPLEMGDNKTGKLMGWIMARILLRESDKLLEISPAPDGPSFK